jgi:uncharacterized short protein YbdD (DUF466 family)
MAAAVADAARRAWNAVAWYVNGVTGQSRYTAYIAHERERHPERVEQSERLGVGLG